MKVVKVKLWEQGSSIRNAILPDGLSVKVGDLVKTKNLDDISWRVIAGIVVVVSDPVEVSEEAFNLFNGRDVFHRIVGKIAVELPNHKFETANITPTSGKYF